MIMKEIPLEISITIQQNVFMLGDKNYTYNVIIEKVIE